MKALTAQFISDDGILYNAAAVEYKGSLWLVAQWRESLDGKRQKPTRIIRLDLIPHQLLTGPKRPADIGINEPIPKAVIEGKSRRSGSRTYDVEEEPDLVIESEALH